jgi:hypothetical protein
MIVDAVSNIQLQKVTSKTESTPTTSVVKFPSLLTHNSPHSSVFLYLKDICLKPISYFKELSDGHLKRYGLTNLKILKARGALSQERFERIETHLKELFRKENDPLPFSAVFKAEKIDRLLDFYTFDELKAKFDAEFASASTSEVMEKIGPDIFVTVMGRKLVDYSRFEALGTVKTEKESYTFEKNCFFYESKNVDENTTRTRYLSAVWG